jgi:hypothetical protein
VIIFEPVIETVDARDFTAWPTVTRPGLGWLALSGELEPADVGTVMAVIAVYNHVSRTPSGEEDDRPSPAALVEGIIRADALIAQGGLRVRDTNTGLTVTPGCCCGLESWHEWDQVVAGQSPWLGHDPEPWVEHLGPVVRVWPDGGDTAVPPAGTHPIEIPAGDLPRLIADAHQQFQEFLDLVEPWAVSITGVAPGGLAPALATHFRVTWPAAG